MENKKGTSDSSNVSVFPASSFVHVVMCVV
jgi:hypothetical protein